MNELYILLTVTHGRDTFVAWKPASNHSVNQLLITPLAIAAACEVCGRCRERQRRQHGRGRRNASDANMLARDDARDHRRSANVARGR